jgi:hypothetical protein
VRATVKWEPIDTVPEGRRVLLWLERGEKGNGEIAVGMMFYDGSKPSDYYWTWGGPNSGDAMEGERPTLWALLPYAPNGSERD